MENYEKLYKEALERARKLATDLPNGRNDRLYHVWDLESIFPELKESKNERNEKIKKEVINMINYYHSKLPCFIPPQFSLEETLAWLEKQGEQKPAWSEDDERILARLIYAFNSYKNSDYRINRDKWEGLEINSILYFLKSIKPQNHWKPSEEQIGALNYAYCELFKRGENGEGSNCVHPLMTLIDDFKKL